MKINYPDMWAFRAKTSLPAVLAIPQAHVALLDDFFRTVDDYTKDPSASQRLRQLFTEDGIWKTTRATFSGVDQIVQSGQTEYFKTSKSIRHWILRVNVNDEAGTQLMLLGRVKSETKDGAIAEHDFGARVEIEASSNTQAAYAPKLKFSQGWNSQQ